MKLISEAKQIITRILGTCLVPKRLNVGDFDAGLTAFLTAGDAGFFVCAAPFWTGVFLALCIQKRNIVRERE